MKRTAMTGITELKKYLGYKFSSGSYTGEDYKSFQTKYINYLKAVCRENHWQLVNVGRNHYCFSAFIKSAKTSAYTYPFRMSDTSRTNGTAISSSALQKTSRTTVAGLITILRWKSCPSKPQSF